MEKAREFQKNIYFCFTDYAKATDYGSQQTMEILKETGVPDHLTCLLTNPYTGQEARVEPDMEKLWFKTGKGV